jgi:hypothetical protein
MKQYKDITTLSAATIEYDVETFVPAVLPPRQLSRTEYIKEKADLLKEGHATIYDIGRDLKLTTKQIEFAKAYTEQSDQFGNGVRAAGKAYDLNPDNKNERNRCAVYANQNLKHAAILTLIDILLDTEGLNDSYVDQQLLFLIQQSQDLKVKAFAIKQYNDLKNRNKKQIEITHNNNFDLTRVGTEELKMLADIAGRAKLSNGQQ